MSDLILRSQRVVLERGVQPGEIVVQRGRVVEIREYSEIPPQGPVLEAGRLAVSPGLVDTHVHVNQPGRTEWEGFRTASRAAAAGGVTTLVDMPLNSVPPTTTVGGLRSKLEAATGKIWVDVGFYGGVVPDNASQLRLLHSAGVLAFKCFLVDSGVPEFPAVTPAYLEEVVPQLGALGARLLAHAELKGGDGQDLAQLPLDQRRRYHNYLASRPESWEEQAVRRLADLAARTGCPIHVVHLASARALEVLRRARGRGVPITVETCPHYLTAAAEEIEDGATLWKCAPPIREASHREALWRGLEEGDIDFVASDHSPAPPEMKSLEEGDFAAAWGGISSLQLTLPLVWTAARQRDTSLTRLSRWLSGKPAGMVGLAGSKGQIAPGLDADFVIWDPEAAFVVTEQAIHHRHRQTPYLGRTLMGRVRCTVLGGKVVYRDGEWHGSPQGSLLLRRPQAETR